MNGHISVSLLVSVVLLDKVKVVTSDDDGTLHLHLDDGTGEDTSTNADVAGEGALFVDVAAIDCLG